LKELDLNLKEEVTFGIQDSPAIVSVNKDADMEKYFQPSPIQTKMIKYI
jgi:hypothetical protein